MEWTRSHLWNGSLRPPSCSDSSPRRTRSTRNPLTFECLCRTTTQKAPRSCAARRLKSSGTSRCLATSARSSNLRPTGAPRRTAGPAAEPEVPCRTPAKVLCRRQPRAGAASGPRAWRCRPGRLAPWAGRLARSQVPQDRAASRGPGVPRERRPLRVGAAHLRNLPRARPGLPSRRPRPSMRRG